ncbi:hypothetical protein R6Q59_035972 [Mikania micrantha]
MPSSLIGLSNVNVLFLCLGKMIQIPAIRHQHLRSSESSSPAPTSSLTSDRTLFATCDAATSDHYQPFYATPTEDAPSVREIKQDPPHYQSPADARVVDAPHPQKLKCKWRSPVDPIIDPLPEESSYKNHVVYKWLCKHPTDIQPIPEHALVAADISRLWDSPSTKPVYTTKSGGEGYFFDVLSDTRLGLLVPEEMPLNTDEAPFLQFTSHCFVFLLGDDATGNASVGGSPKHLSFSDFSKGSPSLTGALPKVICLSYKSAGNTLSGQHVKKLRQPTCCGYKALLASVNPSLQSSDLVPSSAGQILVSVGIHLASAEQAVSSADPILDSMEPTSASAEPISISAGELSIFPQSSSSQLRAKKLASVLMSRFLRKR